MPRSPLIWTLCPKTLTARTTTLPLEVRVLAEGHSPLGSVHHALQTPGRVIVQVLGRQKCAVNIHSEDEKCFVWSVLSALHEPKENKHRVSHYLQYEHELNVEGLSFPMETKHISKFEDLNP